MKFIIPNAINIHARTMKDGRIEFVYEETFIKKQAEDVGLSLEQILNNTYTMMKSFMSDLKVKRIKNGIQVSGKVARTKFGDMMLGEFMPWGTIGNMSFSQMLITILVNTSRASDKITTTKVPPAATVKLTRTKRS